MAAVLTQWPIERKVGRFLLMAVAVFGLANLIFGISTHMALSVAALVVAGAADNVSVVTRMTLMQLETPEDMRGRVAAVNSLFIGGSNQLGEFESGATAAPVGPCRLCGLWRLGHSGCGFGHPQNLSGSCKSRPDDPAQITQLHVLACL